MQRLVFSPLVPLSLVLSCPLLLYFHIAYIFAYIACGVLRPRVLTHKLSYEHLGGHHNGAAV